jgi:hypothetical protein
MNESSETAMADPNDWRTPLVSYLENPSHIADRKSLVPSFEICYA